MSWDIVSKAAETVITNAIIGITKLVPLLPLSPGPDTEGDGPENGGGGDAPTAPEVPGQPSPTPPPPAPPVPPEGAEGPAAEAAKEEARRVGEMLEQAQLPGRRIFYLDNPFLPADTPLDRPELWLDPLKPLPPAGQH